MVSKRSYIKTSFSFKCHTKIVFWQKSSAETRVGKPHATQIWVFNNIRKLKMSTTNLLNVFYSTTVSNPLALFFLNYYAPSQNCAKANPYYNTISRLVAIPLQQTYKIQISLIVKSPCLNS